MAALILLSVILLILLPCLYLLRLRKKFRGLEKFPSPSLRVILRSLSQDTYEWLAQADHMVRKTGKIFKVWIFNKPYVFITDADVIEKIYTSPNNLDKADDFDVYKPWWGTGVIVAGGAHWKNQRRILEKTFSPSILLDFLDTFNAESSKLSKKLEILAKSQEQFDLIPVVAATTMNVILDTAMGKVKAKDEMNFTDFAEATGKIEYIYLARMVKFWLRLDFIWNWSWYGKIEKKCIEILHGFTDKVIAEKREQRQNESTKKMAPLLDETTEPKAFMDHLLDLCAEDTLSDTEVRDQVNTFMVAGSDTTAYTICYTLLLLANYPEEQIKVQNELEEIFGNDREAAVTSSHLLEMNYLKLCVKEALRIYPVIPFNLRRISEDIPCGDGRIIPAGVTAVIMPYVMHRLPEYFHNPEEFQPNRHLPENWEKTHRFAYVPFSCGIRNCIGQKFAMNEAMTILSFLLRKFSWIAVDKREDVKLDLDMVLRPMHGLKFKIIERC